MPDEPALNWSKLPSALQYLRPNAEKYGVYEHIAQVHAFQNAMTEEHAAELAALAECVRLNGDYERINKWLDRWPIDKHQEAARVYFMFWMMDMLDFMFD